MITKPVIVRGGGDLASGTILRLSRAGFPVLVLEVPEPSAIRRGAAFSEAVRLGEKEIEGLTCVKAGSCEEALRTVRPGRPVLLADPEGRAIEAVRPEVLVDAILAKKNLGTRIGMAPLTIALGPGFCAGVDVHYVIETMRGHNLGRIIGKGSAAENTGVPGLIGGYGRERVMHAPAAGILHLLHEIGDEVKAGETLARIRRGDGTEAELTASISGILRGILPEGFAVWEGLKAADIDPRAAERDNCFTVSDKSRCIAGSVLELVCAYDKRND